MYKNNFLTRLKLIYRILKNGRVHILCCAQCGSVRLKKTRESNMSNRAAVRRINSGFICRKCGAKGQIKQSWEAL